MRTLRVPVLMLLGVGSLFAQMSLVLSTPRAASYDVVLSLSLSGAGPPPAALQWTFTYSAAEVLSIDAAAAGTAAAAGKTALCAPGAGRLSCLLSGDSNSAGIASGVVASVSVRFAAGLRSAAIGIANALGATPQGAAIEVSGTGIVVDLSSAGSPAGATPVMLQSIACAPASLAPGGSATCTVTVSGTAGATVLLGGGGASLMVPASVTIPAGASSAAFPVQAGSFPADPTATVTAALNGATRSFPLSLATTLTVTSLACAPASLAPGGSATCTVTVSRNSGAVVGVSSSSAAISAPASVAVVAGAVSAAFAIAAAPSGTDETITVTAALNGSSRTAAVSLAGLPAVTGLACAASVLTTGSVVPCTVRVSRTTGVTVKLSGNSAALSLPAAVTIPAGAAAAPFTAAVLAVAADHFAAITATLNGSRVTSSLQLVTPLRSLDCAVHALLPDTLACTVVTAPAGAGGAAVAIESASARLRAPAQVVVAAGQESAAFAVAVAPSDADETVRLTASFAGLARTATLPLAGIRPTALAMSAATVRNGEWVDARVYLTAPTVPSAVELTVASTSRYLRAPGRLRVEPGQTEVRFRLHAAGAFTVPQNVGVTVSFGRTAVVAALVLTPAKLPPPRGGKKQN